MALSTPHGEAKGDEDKGSPLQNGAKDASGFDTPQNTALNQRPLKIDRSAEALRVFHHPFLFPSETKLCDNTT
jgi:hypothetical protein